MAGAALAAGQFGPHWPVLAGRSRWPPIAGASAGGYTGVAYAEYAPPGRRAAHRGDRARHRDDVLRRDGDPLGLRPGGGVLRGYADAYAALGVLALLGTAPLCLPMRRAHEAPGVTSGRKPRLTEADHAAWAGFTRHYRPPAGRPPEPPGASHGPVPARRQPRPAAATGHAPALWHARRRRAPQAARRVRGHHAAGDRRATRRRGQRDLAALPHRQAGGRAQARPARHDGAARLPRAGRLPAHRPCRPAALRRDRHRARGARR